MVFFKRLSRSRSRSNSQSYVDRYDDENNASRDNQSNSNNNRAASYDEKYGGTPTEEHHDDPIARKYSEPNINNSSNNGGMYPNAGRRPQQQQQQQQQDQYSSPTTTTSQYASGRQQPPSSMATNGYGDYGSKAASTAPTEPAPDLLLQAFNQALRPYSDKIDGLEAEISDLKAYIDALERQRTEVHAWIDKRGLRPDVPPSIAQIMDDSSHASSPTHGAATLNAQLDRKITIVNFDLHRLQDDLNDSLPTPSFSACMLKFLPDIARLSALPTGPRHAFDLLLKLGGNLNSHGGLENGDEEDIAERRSFYGRLDDAMVEVVRGRFREEGESWGVQREIKRIEKTGAYLRNWGVEPYFPSTLEVMREGTGHSGANDGGANGNGAAGAGAAPPGY